MNLSDKIIELTYGGRGFVYIKDVKKAVKKLKKLWVIDFIDFEHRIFKKGLYNENINEIFGDKLVEKGK